MKAAVASDIRSVFNALDRTEADALLKKIVAKYAQDAPRLADWMEENLPEGLTDTHCPDIWKQQLWIYLCKRSFT